MNPPVFTAERHLQADRLCTVDPVAINHFLNRPVDFVKQPQRAFELTQSLGPGKHFG